MIVDSTPSVARSDFPQTPRRVDADVGFLDALGPAFRTENIVGSTAAYINSQPTLSEIHASPSVNVWDQIAGTEYEPYFENFLDAETMIEVGAVKARIDRENSDRRMLQEAGISGFAAQMLAGVADVPSLVPFGALAGGVRTGTTVGRLALSTAGVAGTEAATVEAVLQSQQETRTAEESAFAIGGSVILGGILGGAAGIALSRSAEGKEAFQATSKAIEAELREPAAAGADVPIRPELTDFALPTRAAERVRGLPVSGLSYTDRFAKAQSPKARQYGDALIANEYAYSGTDRLGMEPSVERVVDVENDRYQAVIAKTFREDFKTFASSGGTLSRREFSERVAAAMRRGDADPEHEAISQTAQRLRQSVVDPLKDEAIRMGKLPEDVRPTTAASYLTRMWDQNRIVARSREFQDRLSAKFSGDMSRADPTLSADEVDTYARVAAEDVFHQLVDADSPLDGMRVTVKARGPLKERTLNVADVDFEDFLINDAEFVMNRYSRIMTAEVELTRRFGRADMKDQIGEIRSEYDALRDAAKTEKDRKAIHDEGQRVIRSFEAARDMVRGTYLAKERASRPYRAMQMAMTYNYIRALGDVVRSSLPDVFKITMANGIAPVARDALLPMMRDLKGFRVSQKKAAEAAGIAEVLLNNRLMRIADITDPYARRGRAEETLSWMGSKSGLLSGMLHWNQFLKESVVYLANARMLRMAENGLATRDQRMLQRLKITSANWEKIKGQLAAHATKIDGIVDPGLEHWPADIRRIYSAALRGEADTVIVTPGIGDKMPLIEEYWFLKPAMQFKSFALASHRKTMMVGLQEDQARFIQNALLMSSMGMFVYWLKALSYDGEPSDNPGTWLAEGVDRSGVVPLVMEMNNIAESLGAPGTYYLLALMTGDDDPERASRYQVRNTSSALAGPTAGALENAAMLARGALTGEFGSGEVTAGRRLLPFGNHPGVKEFLNLWAVPEIKEAIE
ncbi:hypothetical protein [Paracoccus saliphilus]|uniref:Large polyvalent protein associated domain-containing protein n=1 Tax=Paracoccus saliphilus TaxID=405559 RepID=A0AA45W4L1_9RHOB|nr:hypothetical protein [Paracoccus saliphilus]WCR04558.1 hypothetical protein JHX88_07525 [Paracoccus saliphilus]SIS86788.1 hypothetical protein SAMN05421772_10715 [Paracoccus saliphilus]